MQFVCVDRIQLSYCYGTDVVKAASTSYIVDTYIDEQSCKFYILKKYETSEMRYIDAMSEFIVEDEETRAKLSSYIKKLLQKHQNDAEQGLNSLREKLTQTNESPWTIPKGIKKDVTIPLPVQEKETTPVEKPVITKEQIEELMKEPSRRLPLPPKRVTNEDDATRLTSFPERAGAIESNETFPTKTPSTGQAKPKSDNSVEREHTPSSSTSTVPEQNRPVSQDHEPKSKSNTTHRDGKT